MSNNYKLFIIILVLSSMWSPSYPTFNTTQDKLQVLEDGHSDFVSKVSIVVFDNNNDDDDDVFFRVPFLIYSSYILIGGTFCIFNSFQGVYDSFRFRFRSK
eukprot:TRINITY_DN311_c1_g1_i3.p1 TRINITY_DN311_c1_g1~~TRINITY_DN311_c1_g1_i3.p1  ORF type:complete len:101 (-),score=8.53 TRINITY_DN311_c1_g1_i3:1229-1531(-)